MDIRGCIPDQYPMVPAGIRPVGPSLSTYFEIMFGFDFRFTQLIVKNKLLGVCVYV